MTMLPCKTAVAPVMRSPELLAVAGFDELRRMRKALDGLLELAVAPSRICVLASCDSIGAATGLPSRRRGASDPLVAQLAGAEQIDLLTNGAALMAAPPNLDGVDLRHERRETGLLHGVDEQLGAGDWMVLARAIAAGELVAIARLFLGCSTHSVRTRENVILN